MSGQLYPPAPTPELQLPDAFVLRAVASHSEIAVVLHLCEPAVWDEIDSLMKNIPFHFDLFVSLVHGSSGDLKQDIEARYPGAIVLVFPDIGRDMFPFVFQNTGVFSKYCLVCKIHSELNGHQLEGDKWRRDMLSDFLGSPENSPLRARS